jgi:ArsR family transcriptional regulator
MEMKPAVTALAALAHESRLSVFRLLVEAGPEGLAAGQISDRLGVPPSSLSFHLKELSYADLVTSRQQGRFVIYAANFTAMNALLAFLTENCCGGKSCTPNAAASDGAHRSTDAGSAPSPARAKAGVSR